MRQSTVCSGCGSATGSGAAFCGRCGTAVRLDGSASAPVPPAAAPPPAAVAPTARRPAAPRWGGGRDLTRYLCAAAYLDRDYAKALIKEVAAEPHLGVAAAPACDVPVVIRHAYLANARRHGRDLVLAVLLLLTLLFPLLGRGTSMLLWTLLAAWVTVLSFELSTRYGRHLQSLRPDRFDPAAAPPPPNEGVARRLRQIGHYADGNVTAYSGYSPFTGYGGELESWSLTFDVTVSDRAGGTPRDFDVTELYAHMAERVGTLVLPELEIEEHLFVDGSTLLDDRRFLPDPLGRPVTGVPADQVDALKRAPEEGARPYLAVHSTGWGGEVVTSLFLRFVRSNSNLFVEAVQTVLCPLLDRYRIIDTLMPRPTVREVAELVVQSLISTVFVLLASPARAIAGFAPDFWMTGRVRRQDKQITRLRWFDYGARQSVRERAAATDHQRYFQKADSGMVLKTVERRVLDALVEFAEAHDIDAGDLRRRQETIINNGIIATDGARVESSSVASGSKASVTNVLNRIPLVNVD